MPQVICPVCNKSFRVSNAHLRKITAQPCCSRECRSQYQRKHPKPLPAIKATCACGCNESFMRPARAPNRIYKKGHGRRLDRPDFVEAICSHCQKAFQLQSKRVKKFKHVYCSRECAGTARETMVTKPCFTCGKSITRKQSRIQGEHVFCDSKCFAPFIAQHRNRKIETYCSGCGKTIQVHPSKIKKNKKVFCGWQCRNRTIIGTGNPSYRSGLGRRGKYLGNWRSQRRATLIRDNYTCQNCGKQPKQSKHLHVHHITPAYQFGDDWKSANDLSNLITLCLKCHKQAEKGLFPIQRFLL